MTHIEAFHERQAMDLNPGSTLHGFTVQRRENLPEIDGEAILLAHEASGARLLCMRNGDSNKAFSISFKTPPQDDTGVFHILEHSVLCGSDKFPVKEPFVNLLKSSMQTFLNALTFSDKTMYPVASTNEQDLLNLMDVYLDAVLHPMIYRKRAIFEQEGWHYELADGAAQDGEDGASPGSGCAGEAGRLRCNGVVYNEMKGALSDASSVLYDEIQKALFPATAYRFESGGDPRFIPTLSYEQYLDEHRRHYRLDNSYLTLYGDADIDRVLSFLDERYLTPVAEEQRAWRGERLREGAAEEALQARSIEPQEPVLALGVVRTMDTAPENACMGLGFVIGGARERTRIMAVDVLLDAIMGSNEAPLKRALLDAGLADDATGSLAEATMQPFAMMELKGLREGAPARFRDTARAELARLADGGLDHGLVEAALSRYEFVMREREFGMADGVALSINALSGWLYDDDAAIDELRYEEDFAFLRRALEDGYFESLIREVFLDNLHQAEVEVRPQKAEGPAEEALRLAEIERGMGPSDFSRIEADVEKLRELQIQPDSPEALATLPRLSRSDIQDAPAEPPYRLDRQNGMPCIRHGIPTHGIAYAYRYFPANRLAFDELPYASVLCCVLGKLGTARHSAQELDTLVNGKLGNLSFFVETYQDETDPSSIDLKLVESASALSDNAAHLAGIPLEVMASTDFSDAGKIRDILMQRRVEMEQWFAQAGHAAAMLRAGSYCTPAGMVAEQLSGVSFYRFLKDLLANFDERFPQLSGKLAELACRLFASDGQVLSFSGSNADFERFLSADRPLPAAGAEGPKLAIPRPVVRNEAFIVPTDVCYASLGYDRRLLADAKPYTAAWQVGARALSYDYLWNEVRVKGGAYGVGFQAARTGNLRFYSYRDPHLDETLARFAAAPGWLRGFDPVPAELDGYVISTVASFDSPLKARMLMRRQDKDFFSGRTPQMRAEAREQMLGAARGDLLDLADCIEAACEQRACCAFGSKEILEASKEPFEVVDLLDEQAG